MARIQRQLTARATLPAQDPVDDDVNHPSHYTQGDIECIDAIKSMLGQDGYIAFLRGQVAKYNWRVLNKGNSVKDAKKAQFYLNAMLDELEAQEQFKL